MAIYSFSGLHFGRSGGQSAVAKAAYQSREKLLDRQTGLHKDYSRQSDEVLFKGIYAPKDAPAWAHDRESLWNAVEQREKHPRAEFGRRFVIALPHELTTEQNRFLLQDFVRENFVRKGHVADVAIHAPDHEGDQRNIHAHVLVTARKLNADGWEKTKERNWKTYSERERVRAEELQQLRMAWEHLANRHLQRHGHEERIDHRSLVEQDIDRDPTQHAGPTATAMRRQGKDARRIADQKQAQRDYQITRYQLERLLFVLEQLHIEAQTAAHDDKLEVQRRQQEAAYYQALEEQHRDYEQALRR